MPLGLILQGRLLPAGLVTNKIFIFKKYLVFCLFPFFTLYLSVSEAHCTPHHTVCQMLSLCLYSASFLTLSCLSRKNCYVRQKQKH